jgi:hypothetical protein
MLTMQEELKTIQNEKRVMQEQLRSLRADFNKQNEALLADKAIQALGPDSDMQQVESQAVSRSQSLFDVVQNRITET